MSESTIACILSTIISLINNFSISSLSLLFHLCYHLRIHLSHCPNWETIWESCFWVTIIPIPFLVHYSSYTSISKSNFYISFFIIIWIIWIITWIRTIHFCCFNMNISFIYYFSITNSFFVCNWNRNSSNNWYFF